MSKKDVSQKSIYKMYIGKIKQKQLVKTDEGEVRDFYKLLISNISCEN